ncbi:hypothetical protein Dda_9014 [Drechslerella dactyloides]|uniref:Uncharacterized protein n=1 Tax=Drechslerella dactyloides TaxID=74499 RepID=A0AAD6NFH2_DREDA|nr:hypothetical protein Dda_9014 [Drechslerella dactyloides]
MPSWPLEPIDAAGPVPAHGHFTKKPLKCQLAASYSPAKYPDRIIKTENAPQTVFGIVTDHDSDSNGSLKRFRTHSTTPSSPTLISTRLPFVRDMHAIANAQAPSSDASLEAALVTCRTNHSALAALLSFLDPAALSTAANSSSIFEHFLCNGTPHVNAFTGTTFSFPLSLPSAAGIEYTQHLHIRGSPPSRRLSNHKSVNIVTSACLWSVDVVSFISDQLIDLYSNATSVFDAPSLPDSLLHHPFTLCELDTISRLSNSIADLACTILTSSLSANHPMRITITLDIPRIQYYLSGPCSHFDNPGIVAAWTTIVDTRKACIEQTFAQCITAEIARRMPASSLNDGGCSYSISFSEGLDPIRPFILQSMTAAASVDKINIEECILHLRRAIPEWDVYFNRLPGAAPTTVEELWFASYVYEIVRPFLVTVTDSQASTTRAEDDVLILQVDNIYEAKPYMKARKFLETYTKARRKKRSRAPNTIQNSGGAGAPSVKLIGIYPSERIFYSKEGTQRSSLHKYDPGMKFATTGEDGNASGESISAARLLEEVYGFAATSSLLAIDVRP